jgi:pimeloyl-ACP methyl ester carboxylesterase
MTTTVPSTVAAGGFVSAGGIATHFHDAGAGDPVVLLHGSGPGVSAWANWQHTIGPLAQQVRVLAPDIVGFGGTERPADIRYSLRSWTDHVWAFLDELGIERFSVIGNSLGGRIALQLAEDRPERLAKMVLMGSPGVGMTPTDGLRALRAYQPSPANMRALLTDYFAVDTSIVTDELVRIRYEASAAPGVHEAYTAMFHDPRHAGSELGITADQVRAVTAPTLVVHGRQDKVIPVGIALTMSELLPDADLQVFARCGHWTQIERAAEFNALVASFLSA